MPIWTRASHQTVNNMLFSQNNTLLWYWSAAGKHSTFILKLLEWKGFDVCSPCLCLQWCCDPCHWVNYLHLKTHSSTCSGNILVHLYNLCKSLRDYQHWSSTVAGGVCQSGCDWQQLSVFVLLHFAQQTETKQTPVANVKARQCVVSNTFPGWLTQWVFIVYMDTWSHGDRMFSTRVNISTLFLCR